MLEGGARGRGTVVEEPGFERATHRDRYSGLGGGIEGAGWDGGG